MSRLLLPNSGSPDPSERRRAAQAYWETRYQHLSPAAVPVPFLSLALQWLEPLRQACLTQPGGILPVLELGCGQGREALALADAGYRVVGLELAHAPLVGLARADRLVGMQADMLEALPFADQAFMAVFSHFVLSGDLSEAEVGRVLAELHRVIAPGGLLLLAVRSVDDPTCRAWTGQPGHCRLGETGLHFFSRKGLRHQLQACSRPAGRGLAGQPDGKDLRAAGEGTGTGFQVESLEALQYAVHGEPYGVLHLVARRGP